MRRQTKISLLAGGLVAGGLVAAIAGAGGIPTAFGAGASPATGAMTSTGRGFTTAALSNRGVTGVRGTTRAATTPITGTAPLSGTAPGPNGFGGGRHGFGGRSGYNGGDGGGYGGFDGELTVTSVTNNTIAATGRGGQTITVQVSATTAYTEAGASASLSDIAVGSRIAVRSTAATTGGTTIDATGVTIVLPQVAGVVTQAGNATLTLTGFDGSTRTVTVTSATRYQKAGQSAALADIVTGTAIVVEGTTASDGSLSAVRVTIQVPRIGGQVTATSGSSYTVASRDGTSDTITTSSSTTYVNADGSAASSAMVKVGVSIIAEGALSSDGKTLTAQRIVVMPSLTEGAGPGFGGHGGFGGGFDGSGTGTQGSGATGGAPSGTSTSGTGNI